MSIIDSVCDEVHRMTIRFDFTFENMLIAIPLIGSYVSYVQERRMKCGEFCEHHLFSITHRCFHFFATSDNQRID